MLPSYEREYVEAEKTNAWFLKRKELVYELIKNQPKSAKILEIGCGSGYILDHLKKNGFTNIEGVDASKTWLPFYKNIKKGTKLPTKKNSYDIILLLDVIEHVKTEKTLLKKIHDLLKKDGILLISAPAYMFMWSHHDVLNRHYRRYTRTRLNKPVIESGFDIIKSTYWNAKMLPPIYLIKMIQKMKKSKASNMEVMPTWTNNIYKAVLGLENLFIGMGIKLPFGLSVFTLAKKR